MVGRLRCFFEWLLFNDLTYPIVSSWPTLTQTILSILQLSTTDEIDRQDSPRLWKLVAVPIFYLILFFYFSPACVAIWLPDVVSATSSAGQRTKMAIVCTVIGFLFSNASFISVAIESLGTLQADDKPSIIIAFASVPVVGMGLVWLQASASGFIRYIHRTFQQSSPDTRAIAHELDPLAGDGLSAAAGALNTCPPQYSNIEVDSNSEQELVDRKSFESV